MKKKGFTLIELLAVIAILAILVIVAVPNIMNMFQNAKKGTFVTQAQNIFKSAENTYLSDQLDPDTSGSRIYCKSSTGSGDDAALDLSGNKNVYYRITAEDGNITSFAVTDGKMSITIMDSPVTATDIDKNDILTTGAGFANDVICSAP